MERENNSAGKPKFNFPSNPRPVFRNYLGRRIDNSQTDSVGESTGDVVDGKESNRQKPLPRGVLKAQQKAEESKSTGKSKTKKGNRFGRQVAMTSFVGIPELPGAPRLNPPPANAGNISKAAERYSIGGNAGRLPNDNLTKQYEVQKIHSRLGRNLGQVPSDENSDQAYRQALYSSRGSKTRLMDTSEQPSKMEDAAIVSIPEVPGVNVKTNGDAARGGQRQGGRNSGGRFRRSK